MKGLVEFTDGLVAFDGVFAGSAPTCDVGPMSIRRYRKTANSAIVEKEIMTSRYLQLEPCVKDGSGLLRVVSVQEVKNCMNENWGNKSNEERSDQIAADHKSFVQI